MKRILTIAVLALPTSVHAATLYRITDLGDLPGGADFSQAHGINDAGDPLAATSILTNATAIKDVGQIVGYGSVDGTNHSFLLTPVPIPATLPLFISALAGVVMVRRSSQQLLATDQPSRKNFDGTTHHVRNVRANNALPDARVLTMSSLFAVTLAPNAGAVLVAAFATTGFVVSPVPVPGAILFLGSGIAALMFRRRGNK